MRSHHAHLFAVFGAALWGASTACAGRTPAQVRAPEPPPPPPPECDDHPLFAAEGSDSEKPEAYRVLSVGLPHGYSECVVITGPPHLRVISGRNEDPLTTKTSSAGAWAELRGYIERGGLWTDAKPSGRPFMTDGWYLTLEGVRGREYRHAHMSNPCESALLRAAVQILHRAWPDTYPEGRDEMHVPPANASGCYTGEIDHVPPRGLSAEDEKAVENAMNELTAEDPKP